MLAHIAFQVKQDIMKEYMAFNVIKKKYTVLDLFFLPLTVQQ